MIQYIFECIEKGYSFGRISIFILILCTTQIGIHILSAYYDYYFYRNNPKIFGSIYGGVIKKSINIPLYKYESPDYYDEYTRALDEAEDRAKLVVYEFANACGDVAAILCIFLLIMQWDPVILLFTIIPIINDLVVNKIRSRIIWQQKNNLNRDSRHIDYCKRVFYEKKYANEIRLFPIKRIYLDLQEKSCANIAAIKTKYAAKLVTLDIYSGMMIQVILLMSCSIYASYKIIVQHSLSVGIYVSMVTVILNMSNSLKWLLYKVSQLANHGVMIEGLRKFMENNDDEASEEGRCDLKDSFNEIVLKDVWSKTAGNS
ncbi:MAG: transporter related [Herbinix sp.]|jgi:ATP-binding cassette subfamily B protein|nr:transporter related [Herbinix sp.]